MKLFPKPITIQGRLEKFPTPLTRSLRSNNGRSKSRGSSSRRRLSPLFLGKTNEETLDPSSPRVTCFGEVRASINSSSITTTTTTSKGRRKWGIEKILVSKSNIKTSRSVWGRWILCFQVGFCHRKVEHNKEEESVNLESRNKFMGDEEIKKTRVLISSSPPKGSLLLMKSRSENYRPSSLAYLFWGSTLESNDFIKTEEEEEEIPKLTNEPEIEEKLGFYNNSDELTTIRKTKFEEELEKIRMGCDFPRVLRRTKSDPTRTSGEFEFDSENYFWKRRRFDYEEPYPNW